MKRILCHVFAAVRLQILIISTALYIKFLTFAVEDLKLNAVEALQGIPYLAIGKHLCGPATGSGTFCS